MSCLPEDHIERMCQRRELAARKQEDSAGRARNDVDGDGDINTTPPEPLSDRDEFELNQLHNENED